MRKRDLPTQEVLREWFNYDPETGIFIWKKVHYSKAKLLGQPAGSRRKTGYIFIGVPGGFGQLGAHRLAWIYMYGFAPSEEIDHEDTDPSNNKISNLRPATSMEQKRNKKVQCNNRSGLKGAFYHACRKGKKWRSQIKVDERLIFLGYFATAMEAHEAYRQAAEEHFGQFARAA